MKFIDKVLNLMNDKVLIICLEICLMLNNISLNRPALAVLWLVCIILNIIVLNIEDKNEE